MGAPGLGCRTPTTCPPPRQKEGRSPPPHRGENTGAAGAEGDPPPGDTAAAPPPDAASSGLITFLVPPEAAQLITALDPGQMYLTLVGPDYEPAPIPALDLAPDTPLPGESGSELTPYGPDGTAAG